MSRKEGPIDPGDQNGVGEVRTVRTLGVLDGEVGRWLREAADSASAIP
ncbi:hypothetical protein ABZZ20_24075 [Streptomyces sp. NPDC006430]